MSKITPLVTRFTRRPLLLYPAAAEQILSNLRENDPRGFAREGRLDAMLRKIGLGRNRTSAMDDDYGDAEPERPSCYTPLWAQQSMGEPEDEGFCWSLYRGVAIMEVANALTDRGEYYCGAWYHGYDTILAGLQTAYADSRVQAIFVRASSPGGVVAPGLPELAAWIRENRAAAGGKPIWFYCDMACSAMYWIVSAADHVSAGGVGLIGSIGAVYTHVDYSEAYAAEGIKIEPIIFGAEKVAGAHWAPLSATAREDLQAEIDQCGRDFVADISRGRPQLSAETLIGTQARVFMGQHDEPERSALSIGLIDSVMTEQQAFEALLASLSAFPSTAPAGPLAMHTQETDMKLKLAAKPAGKKAEAEAEEAAVTPPADGTAEEEADEGEGDADGETEADKAAGAAGSDSGSEPSAAAEVARISGSAEAQKNPALALKAINAGMTFAQFKAVSEVAGPEAKAKGPNALREAMAGVKRVGADSEDGGKKTAGNVLVENARARAGK
jgi:ClpP class serine protease